MSGRRVAAVLALVAVVALVLAGLQQVLVGGSVLSGGDDSPSPSALPSASADATEPPEADLASFYDQSIDWQPCEGRRQFDCARLTVPVDYADPGADTLDLALLRVPATGERLGSLVVNPGGPGAPGTEYAAAADQQFGRALRSHFDIVGFDPRGTGDSAPVTCLDDAAMDSFVAADPTPDTADERRGLVRALAGFYAGCVQRSGDVAAHVSTVEAARDMDVLRAALGESTLTYLGASYGTKLGATYAQLFPERVGRFVLDGAVDIRLSAQELALGQAGGFETALRAYATDCVDGGDCFLGDSVEAALARIRQFLDEVDASPLPGSGDRDLEIGNAFYGVAVTLYNRDYWPLLTQGLQQAFAGNGGLLLQLSDAYTSRNPDGTYADNSAQAIYQINCLDDPFFLRPGQVAGVLPEFEKVSPTLGDAFAWGLVSCDGIRTKAGEPAPDTDAAGAAPIVVIGTTRDPATPYAWAQALADELASGVLVSRDGDGHTGYHSGNSCVDDAVEGYLVAGTVPTDGLSC